LPTNTSPKCCPWRGPLRLTRLTSQPSFDETKSLTSAIIEDELTP
jgi:hypothetical protein